MLKTIRPYIKNLSRIVISLLLISWFLINTDLKGLINAIKGLSLIDYSTGVFLYLAAQVISSLRWFTISKALGFPGSFKKYFNYYMVGMYFNLFLPTGIGGDFFKILYISKDHPHKLKATYTILIDRGLGLCAMFTIGAIATFITRENLPGILSAGLKATGIISAACVAMLFPLSHIARRFFPSVLKRYEAFFVFINKKESIFKAFTLSLIIQSLGMAVVAVLGHGMKIGLSPLYYYVIFPVIALLIIAPISFNGIGLREGGFIYFLSLKGVPQETALALSLSFFSVQIIASLAGGIVYGIGGHKKQ